MKVEFFRHGLTREDIDRVSRTLESVFLTTGKQVHDFEDKLARYLDISDCVGLTSCTAAMHLCLLAWDIGPGHEVITTPMTFCATANAVLHAGATPVFVDVEPDTGNLDPARVEAAITERTRAILPVHLYGLMCDMKALRTIADKHGLVIIEDAAHCIEGVRDGIKPGQLGEAVCFSFYATKNITSGEGGAVATSNHGKAEDLRMLRLHGIDKSAADRYTGTYKHWDMPVLGWKYNMDNIQGALLKGQMDRIDSQLEKRAAIAEKYDQAFSAEPKLGLMARAAGSRHANHLYTIRVPAGKRDDFLVGLQNRGIGVAVNFRSVHLLEYFRKTFGYKRGDFPHAEKMGDETLSLPLYPRLEEKESDYVIESVLDLAKSL